MAPEMRVLLWLLVYVPKPFCRFRSYHIKYDASQISTCFTPSTNNNNCKDWASHQISRFSSFINLLPFGHGYKWFISYIPQQPLEIFHTVLEILFLPILIISHYAATKVGSFLTQNIHHILTIFLNNSTPWSESWFQSSRTRQLSGIPCSIRTICSSMALFIISNKDVTTSTHHTATPLDPLVPSYLLSRRIAQHII